MPAEAMVGAVGHYTVAGCKAPRFGTLGRK